MAGNNVIAYIDGFNLYYGAVKGTNFKWLDLAALCRMLLRPDDNLVAIKYYTATVSARPGDVFAPARQQIYLRALQTIPILTVHYGLFRAHPVRMPLADSVNSGREPEYVRVLKTEEKGSDVNLASHVLHDAHLGRYDLAILVSNDSDLVEPLRLVRKDLGKRVGVFNPHRSKHPSRELMENADFVKNIRSGVLANCQFPKILEDSVGRFHKPESW